MLSVLQVGQAVSPGGFACRSNYAPDQVAASFGQRCNTPRRSFLRRGSANMSRSSTKCRRICPTIRRTCWLAPDEVVVHEATDQLLAIRRTRCAPAFAIHQLGHHEAQVELGG